MIAESNKFKPIADCSEAIADETITDEVIADIAGEVIADCR